MRDDGVRGGSDRCVESLLCAPGSVGVRCRIMNEEIMEYSYGPISRILMKIE